ncbi:hypothetical protein A2U01_0078217, partial [Trifolium medium]|nr:hypothetical protein [Trifolium medium]
EVQVTREQLLVVLLEV